MSLPDNFINSLSKKKIIPFVGAGVSMNVEDKSGNRLFPSWEELLQFAVEKLKGNGKAAEAKLVEANLEITPSNYLEAAKVAKNYLGSELYDLLKEKFNISHNEVSQSSLKIPKAIWEISNDLIITTNYDKVLSWTSPNKEDLALWDIEAPKEQVDLIRNQSVKQPTIWHLHGYVDNVRNVILTPDGYKRLYPSSASVETEYKAALNTLQTLLVSHTFLFIGYSLDDEYFINQLRYIKELFEDTTGKHYVLIRHSEKDKLADLNLGIEPITFESFGDKMLEKLHEIKAQIETSKDLPESETKPPKTASERFNPRNRVVYIPFNKKGEQVIGRDRNLKEVRKALEKGVPTNIGQAVAFQGLGGLGKTQLAIEYAYEFQDAYKDGVFWLTVDQDIDKQLVEICDKAEWVSPLSEISVKLDVARNRLKQITDCLIVLDNVETFNEEIKSYLPPPSENIHILATSRYELIGFEPIPLKLLSLEESVQMLKQESRRELKEAEYETAGKIAEELGRLPLALELAGGFLRYRNQFSWENYLFLLQQNPREAFKEKFLQGNFTRHDTNVYRTLKVNEEIFKSEPLLIEILNLLTWSGTSAMGVELMCHLLDKNEIELLEALSLGESLKLLQKSKERNAFAIHRLVGEVRKEDVPITERDVWAKNICDLLGDWFQEIRNDFLKLTKYEDELEHLSKWQDHAENFGFEDSSRLLWLQAYPPFYRTKYNEAKEIINRALTIYSNQKHSNQEIFAHLNNDLGSLYGNLGKYQEQFEYQKKALDIRIKLFGDEHPDTAASYNNVGNAYGNLGKYQEKFEYQKKALDIHIKLFGDEHPDTATFYNNVGSAYGDLENYQEKFEYQKKALDIRIKLFGDEHPDMATFYNNVGSAYENLGKYQEQFEYQKKALDIRIKLFGDEHPNTANSYYNISSHYTRNKDYKLAEKYANKAFLDFCKIYGNEHPHTLLALTNLTDIYTKSGKADRGLSLIDKYLDLVPKSNSEYKELEKQKRWIISKMNRPGFRQQPFNKKKHGKKQRRKKRK